MTAPAPTRRYRDPVLGASVVCLFALAGLSELLAHAHHLRPFTEIPRIGGSGLHIEFFIGVGLGTLYWSGYRGLGRLPLALTLLAVMLAVGWAAGDVPRWFVLFGEGVAGYFCGSLLRYLYRGSYSPTAARPGRGLGNLLRCDQIAVGVVLLAVGGLQLWIGFDPESFRAAYLWVAIPGWALLLAFAWVRLFRPFWELGTEPILWVIASFRAAGPGLDRVPYSGPLLVLANHACWWDPLYLAKVLPRPITPMMTAGFFDIWFLRPLMVYVFHVIRVREVAMRRELPEVTEAIAALDRGDCVVIFPEGWLRRKDEVPLRRFGRGVWEILKARPNTPVVPCWIEGGWGSWVSFKDGPPTKNKPLDIRRPIGVGLSAPVILTADVLADHLRTRIHLMNEVLGARQHFGLPPLPTVELPTRGDDDPPA